jgi:hypothetical protein
MTFGQTNEKYLDDDRFRSFSERAEGGRVYTKTKHQENWYSVSTTNRLAAFGTTRADFSWRDRN